MTVSMVSRCYETETHPITFDEIWKAIRLGEHGLKEKIVQIRNRYESEKDITGSVEKAKKAVADLKQELPGFLPSGTFSKRSNDALVEYSAVMCVDMDSLGERLIPIRNTLMAMPFIRAIAISPSGDGLKVFFNVINDPSRHEDSFRNIQIGIRESLEVEIDEKCKDLARICFFTYDQDLWVRTEGNEIFPPADPLPPPPRPTPQDTKNLTSREQIAFSLLGELIPAPEKGGYFVRCPGESFHTNRDGPKHTMLYLSGAPTLDCKHDSCKHVVDSFNQVLRSQIGKAEKTNSSFQHSYRDNGNWKKMDKPNSEKGFTPEIPFIEIFSPDDFKKYEPPPGILLIGDYHIVRDTGFTFVIGGHPSVGKSLAAISLAVAGSKGEGEWFGMTVHRQFKTMIIQTENGKFRLSRNLKELESVDLQDFLRISSPPPYGMLFHREEFRKPLMESIDGFGPDIVILDPWNAAARDQEQKTYLDTFSLIRSILPVDTVLGVLAHTRKPHTDERATGRSLMHVLAGSHVMSSVPRSIFIMQHASDDMEDREIVWTCCKNNDGEPGKRSAWVRQLPMFTQVPDFSWTTFDASDKDKRVVINEEMVKEIFEDGPLEKVDAIEKLKILSGARSGSTCYNALSEKGRFRKHLVYCGKQITWVP